MIFNTNTDVSVCIIKYFNVGPRQQLYNAIQIASDGYKWHENNEYDETIAWNSRGNNYK